jgi:membrane-associated phospholipid phosphatase
MNFKSNSAKKIGIGLLLFLCSNGSIFSQSPYILKSGLDYSLVGMGAISLTAGYVIENNISVLSENDISALNPNSINSLDRGAVENYSDNLAHFSDALLYASMAAPFSLLLDKRVRQDWEIIGIMGLEVFSVTYGLTSVTKGLALRTRPYAYNSSVPMDAKTTVDTRLSFFSGHTAVSASMTFFAARVFSDYHPKSKWKPLVWVGAATIPMVTAWARVASGRHFPTDVITGYAFGAAIGYFIPVVHLEKKHSKTSFIFTPYSNGLVMTMTF